MRLTVTANALIMMKMKHTARHELKDITPTFFEEYKDYLLGDYVYGLRASDDYGGMILPWTLVLSYEHAIRKHCYKIMAQQGMPFKLALEKSWKDATVKERHFTTPGALYAKRGYTSMTSSATATPGDNGSKGKGKGKGKGKKGHSRTPANKPICFRYNATNPKEAARRRLSVTSSMCARYALGIIQLQSVRRRMPRIPRARPTDKCRRSRQLRRYKVILRKCCPCYTCLPVDHDRVI